MVNMMKSKAKPGVRAPKSTIAIIIDKLPPAIHTQLFGSPSSNHDPHAIRRRTALIAKGDEALRILQIKHAMFMPKNMDRPLVRAALIVEYLARNASDDEHSGKSYLRTTIPPEVLAKATGLQKSKDMKKLENMQTVLASYLDGSSVGKKNKKSKKRRSVDYSSSQQHGATASASAMTTSSTMPLSKPMFTCTNLIHDLCIQLGPMIPDAEFAVSYATQLFEVLTSGSIIRMEKKQKSSKRNTSTNNSSKRFSMHQLRTDVERNQEYYEAACFYLAVKKSEGDSSYLKKAQMNMKAAAKKGAAAAKSKSEEGEGDTNVKEAEEEEEYDEDDEHTLQEAHVIRAANLLVGMFSSVLENVEDWTEGVSISLDPVLKQEPRKQDEEASVPKVETIFQVRDHTVGAPQNRQTNKPLDSEFERWKFNVLQNAKRSVEEKLGEAGKGKSDAEKLAIAADDALRKAGIL